MTVNQTEARFMAVVAMELSPGTRPSRAALDARDAGRLAELIGRDLAAFAPEAAALDLVFAAAHFDPAEVLRPNWPLHRRLQELQQRAPSSHQGPRIMAFGADANGQVPMPLQAQADLQGGALRVLPLLLRGDADTVARVGQILEDTLLERGMAAPDTALLMQQGFDAQVEHVRFFSPLDLAAMTAMQYQHQNLQSLWPLIETALLAPEAEEWLDRALEPLVRYANGMATMALLGPHAWIKHQGSQVSGDEEQLNQAYEYFQARQRQLAAVLESHGIPVTFVYCDVDCDPRQMLAA